MKILILEDNKNKFDAAKKCVEQNLNNCEITHFKAFNAAAAELLSGKYDLAIFDNSVPRFLDSDSTWVFNAIEEALEHLMFEDFDTPITTPIIGFSSDEVNLTINCPNYIGFVKYSSSSMDFEKNFKTLFNSIRLD